MRKRPVGVTIIAAIVALLGVQSLCISIIGLARFSVGFLGTIFGLGGGFGVGFLIAAVWGVVALLFAWGLWNMKYWAWWGTVAVLGIKLFLALLALFTPASVDLFGSIISLVVLVYLARSNIRLSFID